MEKKEFKLEYLDKKRRAFEEVSKQFPKFKAGLMKEKRNFSFWAFRWA